jgi:hypothetical protein
VGQIRSATSSCLCGTTGAAGRRDGPVAYRHRVSQQPAGGADRAARRLSPVPGFWVYSTLSARLWPTTTPRFAKEGGLDRLCLSTRFPPAHDAADERKPAQRRKGRNTGREQWSWRRAGATDHGGTWNSVCNTCGKHQCNGYGGKCYRSLSHFCLSSLLTERYNPVNRAPRQVQNVALLTKRRRRLRNLAAPNYRE